MNLRRFLYSPEPFLLSLKRQLANGRRIMLHRMHELSGSRSGVVPINVKVSTTCVWVTSLSTIIQPRAQSTVVKY